MSVLRNVSSLFCNISTKDDFSGKYQIVVNLTEEQATDAEAAGLKIKTKEYEGKSQFQITFKSKFRPRLLGPDGKTEVDLDGSELSRGSEVNVQYKFRDYKDLQGKAGVAADLQMLQVMNFTAEGGSEFDDLSEAVGALGDDIEM